MERGGSSLTSCENVNNSAYPNYGFQIFAGEEWYAVSTVSQQLSIGVTTASATGGSLYSYELNFNLLVLQGADLSQQFAISQPCISTGWSTTLSCTVSSSAGGLVVGNGQALNGMCAGTAFNDLYHTTHSIQNVGVEGLSSSSPVSNLNVNFNQVCYDTNINGGNDIWVMTADIFQ
jgi:hypothetical protein